MKLRKTHTSIAVFQNYYSNFIVSSENISAWNFQTPTGVGRKVLGRILQIKNDRLPEHSNAVGQEVHNVANE